MNKIFYKSLIILAIFSQAGCATQALYSEKNAPKIAKVTPDGVSETTVKAALTPVTLAVDGVTMAVDGVTTVGGWIWDGLTSDD
ncbi:hypothetical protein RCF98_15190 [Thiothrix lacustris]|uniref:Uncharacterized protein n=1 Tax=Thiothrix lacustris TaxID=525917 RepID=A0ABY9MR57_9GAMM|nr:hypothetical protein [Thiothrix lacustris]WML90301.1 hypothetical protein RCF98_15190 [Thiothrix lacustris]